MVRDYWSAREGCNVNTPSTREGPGNGNRVQCETVSWIIATLSGPAQASRCMLALHVLFR